MNRHLITLIISTRQHKGVLVNCRGFHGNLMDGCKKSDNVLLIIKIKF